MISGRAFPPYDERQRLLREATDLEQEALTDRAAMVTRDAVMDIRAIQRILPHRYPFLLIDKVIELDGYRRAVADDADGNAFIAAYLAGVEVEAIRSGDHLTRLRDALKPIDGPELVGTTAQPDERLGDLVDRLAVGQQINRPRFCFKRGNGHLATGEGFAVATLDWRGQGMSDRALRNPRKGYVRNFSQYQIDLETFINEVVLPDCPPPLFALGQ